MAYFVWALSVIVKNEKEEIATERRVKIDFGKVFFSNLFTKKIQSFDNED